MQPQTLMDWALWNAGKGFKVFPIRPGCKKPPLFDKPYARATTDACQIIEWWTRYPNANIGIDTTDMYVLDLDPKGGADAYESARLVGSTPGECFTVSTPSGGEHRYYRTAEPYAGSIKSLGVGLDTRGYHNYVLGAGSQTAAGTYRCGVDVPLARIPEQLRARLSAPDLRERDDTPLIDWDLPSSIELAKALVATKETQGLNNLDYYQIGCQVRDYAVTELTCYEIMQDHFNPAGVPEWDGQLKEIVEHVYDYAKNQPGVAHPDAIFSEVTVEPEPKPPMPEGRWWNAEDFSDDYEEEWLVWEMFPRVGVCLLVAPPSGGKTLVETHLTDCIRTGEKFFGVEPDHMGSSIILASEAFPSLKKRLRALRKSDTPHRIHARPVAALASPRAWATMCEDVIAEAEHLKTRFGDPVRIVALDTLAASGMLADENDNGQAALCMTLLSGLAQKLQCLVLVTHHTTKSGKTERGASALRGGADTVIEIHRDGESPVRTLELTKSRDGETKPIGCFTVESLVLGLDSRGREIKTAIMSTGGPAPKKLANRPVKADKFMEALDNVLAVPNGSEVRDGAVEKYDLRKEFRQTAGFPEGKSQNGNVKGSFDRCVTYFLSTLEIECVLIEGNEFIRKRKIDL